MELTLQKFDEVCTPIFTNIQNKLNVSPNKSIYVDFCGDGDTIRKAITLFNKYDTLKFFFLDVDKAAVENCKSILQDLRVQKDKVVVLQEDLNNIYVEELIAYCHKDIKHCDLHMHLDTDSFATIKDYWRDNLHKFLTPYSTVTINHSVRSKAFLGKYTERLIKDTNFELIASDIYKGRRGSKRSPRLYSQFGNKDMTVNATSEEIIPLVSALEADFGIDLTMVKKFLGNGKIYTEGPLHYTTTGKDTKGANVVFDLSLSITKPK